MMMTNMTRRAMWKSGTMALRMELRTTWRLGTPETSLSGRSTRKALNAFTSKPLMARYERMVEKRAMTTMMKSRMFQPFLK